MDEKCEGCNVGLVRRERKGLVFGGVLGELGREGGSKERERDKR